MRDENSFQEKCKESARDRESVYIFGRRREEEGEIQRERKNESIFMLYDNKIREKKTMKKKVGSFDFILL